MDLQSILEFILNNPVVTAILASSFGTMLLFAGIKIAIKLIFSIKNMDKWGDYIDDMVDKTQKKNKDAGKLLRKDLIALFETIIRKLKAPDGIN